MSSLLDRAGEAIGHEIIFNEQEKRVLRVARIPLVQYGITMRGEGYITNQSLTLEGLVKVADAVDTFTAYGLTIKKRVLTQEYWYTVGKVESNDFEAILNHMFPCRTYKLTDLVREVESTTTRLAELEQDLEGLIHD